MTDLAKDLRRRAFRVEAADAWGVPEPYVKEALAAAGVAVPAGRIAEREPAAAAAAGQALAGPLVLKAWGPGIVHKSELGAVRVGLGAAELETAAGEMGRTLAGHGIEGASYYVEEMAPGGVEVLFGVVARPPFGKLALLGAGGALAELFREPVVRLCPLTPETAREMVETFPAAALLTGYRGRPAADVEALVAAMLRIAGEGGLVDQLGESFAEFECNPLIVGPQGAVAADARLILKDPPPAGAPERPFPAEALFAPKSVAIVGASATRKTAWGNRTLARYREMGWAENLYAVHPTGDIEGYPTYRSLADIPGGVDYAEISVPAEATPAVLRGARGKVKTAVIPGSGFSEVGGAGIALEADLVAAAREGGVRFVGPNCMGPYAPRGRVGFSGATSGEAGHVGALFQSGTFSVELVQVGATQGMRISRLTSAGNAADLKLGDLALAMVDDPQTKTLAIHVEGGAEAKLVEAVRRAAGVKPVVILAAGLSATGARTAASHTGALTSDRRGWEALSQATGATVVETLEELMASVIYLDRFADRLDDARHAVLVIGLGGGASVLSADACDAQGLSVPMLSPELQEKLRDKDGGILLNPLDLRMGAAAPVDTASRAIETVCSLQHFSDVIIHVNMTNYANSTMANRMPGVEHLLGVVKSLCEGPANKIRIGLVARNLSHSPGEHRDQVKAAVKDAPLVLFERLTDAACAIAAAKRFTRRRAGGG